MFSAGFLVAIWLVIARDCYQVDKRLTLSWSGLIKCLTVICITEADVETSLVLLSWMIALILIVSQLVKTNYYTTKEFEVLFCSLLEFIAIYANYKIMPQERWTEVQVVSVMTVPALFLFTSFLDFGFHFHINSKKKK